MQELKQENLNNCIAFILYLSVEFKKQKLFCKIVWQSRCFLFLDVVFSSTITFSIFYAYLCFQFILISLEQKCLLWTAYQILIVVDFDSSKDHIEWVKQGIDDLWKYPFNYDTRTFFMEQILQVKVSGNLELTNNTRDEIHSSQYYWYRKPVLTFCEEYLTTITVIYGGLLFVLFVYINTLLSLLIIKNLCFQVESLFFSSWLVGTAWL